MLCVYDHYKYFDSFSARTVFIRQILTYKDGPRTERVEQIHFIYATIAWQLILPSVFSFQIVIVKK